MPSLKILAASGTLALLCACNHSPAPGTPQPPKPKAAAASTAVPDSNPFKPLLNDRDRARNVQKVLDANAKAQKKALQDAQK